MLLRPRPGKYKDISLYSDIFVSASILQHCIADKDTHFMDIIFKNLFLLSISSEIKMFSASSNTRFIHAIILYFVY